MLDEIIISQRNFFEYFLNLTIYVAFIFMYLICKMNFHLFQFSFQNYTEDFNAVICIYKGFLKMLNQML